ncbi:MAG: GvpL/GvpF family gas vesicle protein [Thermoanaerobaculia bacterium]
MKLVVIGVHLRREDIEPLAMAVDAGDLFLSALEVPDDQPIGDRELLLRVAAKRAELLDRATFLAVRYGFTASSAADARAKCRLLVEQWRDALEAAKNRVEMTLKVAAQNPQPRPQRSDFDSGASYLKALHQSTRAASVEPAFRQAVDAAIASLAARHRWVARDNASLELVALVERQVVPEVNAAGHDLKQRFPTIPFLLSGPWPLEVFVDDHE